MKLTIYQIDGSRDVDHAKFRDSKFLMAKYGEIRVDPGIYVSVFSGELPCKTLEAVFVTCNRDIRPIGFRGHSVSVSDVVAVEESDTVAPGFYFCDAFGFKKILFDTSKTIQKE